MTGARIGYGVKFSRGDGASPEQFVEVAEVFDVSPPSMTKDQVEATNTDSVGGFREFIPGLKDGGECQITMNFLPNNVTQNNTTGGLLHDFLNQTTGRNYRISFPGSPVQTWTFNATVISYQPSAPMDDRMTCVVGFKVAGAPTIA